MVAAKAQPAPVLVPAGSKKKNKQKAYSDPKMSSEMMMQMEASNYPPPLPPRMIGTNNLAFDDSTSAFGQVITNKDTGDGSPTVGDGRPLPNSCATQMHYPLIATSVAVREGLPPGHGNFFVDGNVMHISSSSLPPDLPAAVVS